LVPAEREATLDVYADCAYGVVYAQCADSAHRRLASAKEVKMTAAEEDLKRGRLYLRVSSRQRAVISEAAEATQKDLSAFVLEAAIVHAQRVLADRRVFTLDKSKWESFVGALDRPTIKVSDKPKLLELLRQARVVEVPSLDK
jgi:uncharacterized protein (DUF1778 family)